MHELAIIGGGPAGVSAGVYAARKRLKTVLITETWGGQSTESAGIENWIGTKNIPGIEFGKALEAHVRMYEGPDFVVKAGERVEKIEKAGEGFKVTTNMGSYEAKAVLIATGSTRRKLDIPGAKEYENKGITYCASCDGPLFAGQDVAVVGGGNAGFETAAQLLAYAKSVTLITHGTFKADARTVEKVLAHPNMKGIPNATPVEVKGEKFVKAVAYKDEQGSTHELPVGGIFVEIGLVPTTWFAEGLVEMNQIKQIVVDPKTQRTSQAGVWAAGDSTDGLFHQNNIAAGDAVKALEDIYMSLRA
jgi:alkyl hydroperoxide reductase subunit AhpF